VQGQEAVDAEHGLGLGVRAVELDVAERPLGLGLLLLDARRPRRLSAAERERREQLLGAVYGLALGLLLGARQ
jgi:hypothetical protein